MLFYMQMRWNIENRVTLEDVWDMEVKEGTAASEHFKVVAMYKVAGQAVIHPTILSAYV